jgi:predicted MFS family arabinose efflux permease
MPGQNPITENKDQTIRSDRFPLPAGQERILLFVLAAIQFTHILDFMIVMPLGPRLMEIFRITPSQFGLIVSTYTFSAGLFGLVAAWFLDRFDRKRALLCMYVGFGIGTVACALAPNYHFLVAARFLAGGFGGVTSAIILAIIGDAIPPQRRGQAMGTLFSSFSLASIAGVPAGLFLANHLGWHAPFFLLAALSVAISFMAARILPTMRDHLARAGGERSRPWADMLVVLGRGNHWLAFGLTIVMTMAGFLIVPYLSPSLVANVGVTNDQLPLIYLFGGGATFFSMRYIGRISDRLGLLRVFTWVSVVAVFPILIISHMPPIPVWSALVCTTCFMVFTSGRFIPGMAMVTNSVEARYRGSFMSLNSALQQFASGFASLVAGAIIVSGPGGRLEHYGTVGIIGACCIGVSLVLAKNLKAA